MISAKLDVKQEEKRGEPIHKVISENYNGVLNVCGKKRSHCHKLLSNMIKT